MELKPSREAFCKLAAETNLIAVAKEINMDLDTPVSVYYKLVGEKKGFILESVDTTHQQFGRFSFIGAEPFARLQVFKDKLMINENGLMKCIVGEPVETLKTYMQGYRPAVEDASLPLANGGMVGYLNYDIVATFDRVRGMELGEEELLGQFMICRVLVVYDALHNSARLICLADTKGRDADEAYDAVIEKIAKVEESLSAPLAPQAGETAKRREKVDFRKKFGKAPEDFLQAIHKAKEHIFAGDIFQVVPVPREDHEAVLPFLPPPAPGQSVALHVLLQLRPRQARRRFAGDARQGRRRHRLYVPDCRHAPPWPRCR